MDQRRGHSVEAKRRDSPRRKYPWGSIHSSRPAVAHYPSPFTTYQLPVTNHLITHSIRPRSRVLDHLRPLRDLGLDVGGEFFSGAALHDRALAAEELADLRILQHRVDLGVE